MFNVKVQVQNVPELWRQTFWKVLIFPNERQFSWQLWKIWYNILGDDRKIYLVKSKHIFWPYICSKNLTHTSKSEDAPYVTGGNSYEQSFSQS